MDSLDKCLFHAYFTVGSILGPGGKMENMIAFLSHGEMGRSTSKGVVSSMDCVRCCDKDKNWETQRCGS